ncbi:hypothetical protein MA16_Dca018639 [Dendrobium catenatum]|uniref:Uncharacterized protein n=1 Tax=Dendrobium catenatum TaxID=906689 RepID=A0A2I0W5T9_9ASPA|nr:hypothetical protein MA16_Dca018639 [Dendrobium catenatum]
MPERRSSVRERLRDQRAASASPGIRKPEKGPGVGTSAYRRNPERKGVGSSVFVRRGFSERESETRGERSSASPKVREPERGSGASVNREGAREGVFRPGFVRTKERGPAGGRFRPLPCQDRESE